MGKSKLFLDGLLIPADESFIETLSPSRLSGKGVFETMRSYNGRIFLLKEHLARLMAGLDELDIKFSYTQKDLQRYLYSSLRSNRLENARLRLTVWQQKGQVRNSILTLPYRALTAGRYKRGFTAGISMIRRDEYSGEKRIKSIKYLPFMRAYLKAERKGHDEALLVNRKGHLVEGSRTNIFYVRNGTLYTPALTCGSLKGVTRQKVIELAKAKNIRVRDATASPDQLFKADEAFLTNSLIELMPLTYVDGCMIGSGAIGPVTEQLLKAYRRLIRPTGGKI